MMLLTYQRGFSAGVRRRSRSVCPYDSHTEPFAKLRADWLAGYEAGLLAPTPLKPPKKVPHIPARVRGKYARRRLEQILNGSP